MPTVLMVLAFKFCFYSNDHEPMHVHVTKGDCEARVFLVPEVKLDWNRGFKAQEIKKILMLTEKYCDDLKEAWIDYFKK